jgi:ATP-binding cassette subfamily B (MDR/TAP) protein 1
LNGVKETIEKFTSATQEAYEGASSQIILVGAANGAVMGSFLLCYLPLILYGGYIVYTSVRETGCDPSGTVALNEECSPSASGVFGATLGVTFGGAALPQVLGAIEAFSAARAAAYPALVVMNRKITNGNESEETIVEEKDRSLQRRRGSSIILPKYSIDSSSALGSKLERIRGNIKLRDVAFCYPTRKETNALNGVSLTIPAGKTVALVGPSGGGKSTIVSLMQRFYDPLHGSISMDGENLKDLNVTWLRQQIGIVSQEPKLFALSVRDNIKIAYPEATQEEVEEAAKRANAHDFILSFPDGYDTHVGHEGAQLSGGMSNFMMRLTLFFLLLTIAFH